MTRSMARSQHQIGRIDRLMDRFRQPDPGREGSRRTTSAGGAGARTACSSARRADASAVCAPAHPTPPAEAPGGATRRARRAPSTPTPVLALPRVCLPTAPAHAPGKPKRLHCARGFARPSSPSATAALPGSVLGHRPDWASAWRWRGRVVGRRPSQRLYRSHTVAQRSNHTA
jgi:hypothetical protein